MISSRCSAQIKEFSFLFRCNLKKLIHSLRPLLENEFYHVRFVSRKPSLFENNHCRMILICLIIEKLMKRRIILKAESL